jgi:hypothetical protein
VGWIVGPAAAGRRAVPLLAAMAGALATAAEAALVAGMTAAVACGTAIAVAAAVHVGWRRRLSRTVAS